MTKKEVANRLREMADMYHPDEMLSLADTLDPPKPKPGTVVWWRKPGEEWALGVALPYGVTPVNALTACWNYSDGIEYRPARILADDEVAVKVPPVEEWTPNATAIGIYMSYGDSGVVKLREVITRKEAERMEAER